MIAELIVVVAEALLATGGALMTMTLMLMVAWVVVQSIRR